MLASRGFGMAATSLGLTVFNVGGMLGSLVGGLTIERFGSRISVLSLSGGGIVAALALSALPFDATHGVAGLMLGLGLEGLFVSGVQNGMYAIAAHLYPPFVRATGVGAASGIGRIGAVASAFTGVISLNLGGATGYFLFIAVVMGLTLVAMLFLRTHIARVGVTPALAAGAH
jgi:AAHS family 4-hydroxybenzoate transporter-like MFS transporter